MSELLDLLAGIRAHPDDDAPRLVLADWLDENDNPDRAEFVRLQVRLSRWVPDLDEREALQAREHELLVEHQAAWLGSAARTPNRFYRFERGLIRAVHLDNALPENNPWVIAVRLLEGSNGLRTKPAPQHQPLVANERRFQNSLGMWFQRIPAGTFRMGSTANLYADEREHVVTLTCPFALGTFPVTVEQLLRVLGRPDWLSDAESEQRSHPAVGIGWDMAKEFCVVLTRTAAERDARRTYRLPTEAEWEYACRAGTRTEFNFGDGYDPVWMNGNSDYGQMLPVGCFDPNAFGLYDMHGQVREWCADWYLADLRGLPSVDPFVAESSSATRHVLRGGSWDTSHPSYCRSAYRLYAESTPTNAGPFRLNFGFRVVCEEK